MEGNEDLTFIQLPETVTEIRARAFANCTNLTSINLEHIITIGAGAFGQTF